MEKNQELAKIFSEMADYLGIEEVPFKPQAYKKVAETLESLEKGVDEIYKKNGTKGLEEIPGVGKNIAEKIEEYLEKGKIKSYQHLKKKFPFDLAGLVEVEGMGPKRAALLYKELKIKDVNDLKEAAGKNKIAKLSGFGQKWQENILQSISFLEKDRGRFLLGDIFPYLKKILKKLSELEMVEKISLAGSARRMKETLGDIDILATVKNVKAADKVMDFFVALPGVSRVWMKGQTRSSVKAKGGIDIDLRVVKEKSYGSALQYFTGSKEHNIALRKLAVKKGLKLSEYGLFKGKKMIAGWDEEGIYKALGLYWIEPELRENKGEIELALNKNKTMPLLVRMGDIKGDLHCHSHWGAGKGKDGIKNLVEMAMKLGYCYLGISDHTKFLAIEHGIDEKQLAEQGKYIDRLNRQLSPKFKILKGCEANILSDGSIDIENRFLRKLDYVIAGVHSSFKMPSEKITERVVRAIKNPEVDIIAHPFGRVINRREELEINFTEIIKAAKDTGTILEINANPHRLDLKDVYIRKAKEAGIKMIIGADSHRPEQMAYMNFGLAQARRGWAEKKDIVNTFSTKGIMKFFEK
jgi:DNA polymerase (family X)